MAIETVGMVKISPADVIFRSTAFTRKDNEYTLMPEGKMVDDSGDGQNLHRNLHFDFHEPSGELILTVSDETGKVLRKMPAEELLNWRDTVQSMVGEYPHSSELGLLLSRKA